LSARRSLLSRPVIALVMVVALGVVYGLSFPDRTDYVGHFLAGAGGTFMLVALVAAVSARRPWAILGAVVAAIILGVFTEATIFRLAEFDPVDLANQSIGAVLAGLGLVNVERAEDTTGVAFLGGFVLLIVGFFYAFA
jgi:hypothetical protein